MRYRQKFVLRHYNALEKREILLFRSVICIMRVFCIIIKYSFLFFSKAVSCIYLDVQLLFIINNWIFHYFDLYRVIRVYIMEIKQSEHEEEEISIHFCRNNVANSKEYPPHFVITRVFSCFSGEKNK